MKTDQPETSAETARRWRRWLWETAETGKPCLGLTFEDAVYYGSDLADLMGEDAYVNLVQKLAADPDTVEIPGIARQVLDATFPHTCRCRGQPAMDLDILDFTAANVHRRLYTSDESLTQHMRLLFRRTPWLELFECIECGDIWLQNMDMKQGVQLLALIEPSDLKRIEDGVWPVELDGVWPDVWPKYEDPWASGFVEIRPSSSECRAWQAAHNPPDSFARFGK